MKTEMDTISFCESFFCTAFVLKVNEGKSSLNINSGQRSIFLVNCTKIIFGSSAMQPSNKQRHDLIRPMVWHNLTWTDDWLVINDIIIKIVKIQQYRNMGEWWCLLFMFRELVFPSFCWVLTPLQGLEYHHSWFLHVKWMCCLKVLRSVWLLECTLLREWN